MVIVATAFHSIHDLNFGFRREIRYSLFSAIANREFGDSNSDSRCEINVIYTVDYHSKLVSVAFVTCLVHKP